MIAFLGIDAEADGGCDGSCYSRGSCLRQGRGGHGEMLFDEGPTGKLSAEFTTTAGNRKRRVVTGEKVLVLFVFMIVSNVLVLGRRDRDGKWTY